jgi:hypothetical protein
MCEDCFRHTRLTTKIYVTIDFKYRIIDFGRISRCTQWHIARFDPDEDGKADLTEREA